MTLDIDERVLRNDLLEIARFIARQDRAAANRVLDAIDRTFRDLRLHPLIGKVYPLCGFRKLRMVPVERFRSYLVFYTVTEEAVRILYVVHGSRDLPEFLLRDERA